MESSIPVEVLSPTLFRKNPTPTIFEGLNLVNGVQPQLNCNVCGTGDIRINGLDGPYTMVLMDGMPIVSSEEYFAKKIKSHSRMRHLH